MPLYSERRERWGPQGVPFGGCDFDTAASAPRSSYGAQLKPLNAGARSVDVAWISVSLAQIQANSIELHHTTVIQV